MDFLDLDTSLKVTLQNTVLYSNWLEYNKTVLEATPSAGRSNFIKNNIGFVESNPGAIISYLKKSGLVDSQLTTSKISTAISNRTINYREYCLIHLSKESIFLYSVPSVNVLSLICRYIVSNHVNIFDLNKIRELGYDLQIVKNNTNSNKRTDYLSTELEGTGLFIVKGKRDDGILQLAQDALPVVEFLNTCVFENCLYPLNSNERFDYFASTNGGILEYLKSDKPAEWTKFFPNLDSSLDFEKSIDIKKNQNKKVFNHPLQQIFYGAPGTGKSDSIDRICKSYIHYRVTFHPDSDYSSFVGCYKPAMANGTNIICKNELINKLSEIKSTGISYPCHKFSAKYWESLVAMSAGDIKEILTACGFADTMAVEVSKGVAIGQAFSNEGADKRISYSFVPQAFTKAYIKAWKLNEKKEKVYLIIEEINRGNCAQIFGDLFQLLDRGDDGYSKYEINPDAELQKYIANQGLSISNVFDSDGNDISVEINSGKLLKLPDNLCIWATMNTSDQSLFPIDSAFKRRWDWKYIKITDGFEKDKDGNYILDSTDQKVRIGWKLDYKVKDSNDSSKVIDLDWWNFIEQINKIVSNMTSSADKQLGYFFCKADPVTKVISKETFVSKVIFYLWNDVFKDYGFEDDKLFKYKNKKGVEDSLTFPDFYDEDGNVDKDVVDQFVDKVMSWKPADNKND